MRLISRIVNFVKIWVENYYHLDFHEHNNREALEMFIEGIEEEKLQAMLKTHINRKVAHSNLYFLVSHSENGRTTRCSSQGRHWWAKRTKAYFTKESSQERL